MEEIEKMLDENGNFNLDDIQVLLDELVYNFDINEENESDLQQYKEDVNTFVRMHNEYNEKIPEYAMLIKSTNEKIEMLNKKQERLNGRISKREVEEKNILEQQLNDLNQQYEEAKNNRIEAKKGYNETKEKYDELLKVNKEEIAKKQFEEYANKLESICKYCLSKMKEKDDKLVELHQAIKDCVDPVNASGYISEYTKELDERNKFYSNYEKVVKFISESEEYQSTVSKDLVSELSKQIEEESMKTSVVEKPVVEEPVVEEPVVEEPVVEEPVVEEPVVEETVVEETVVEEPVVEEPVVEEPVVEEPVVEEPVVEEPVVEEPVVEEPVVEESVVEEPVVEEPVVEEPVVEEPVVEDNDEYLDYGFDDVEQDYDRPTKLFGEKMSLEQLAQEGPLFKDEERVDENHNYMSYQNAKNLGLTNEEQLEAKEEKSEVSEKVSFFNRIKEKFAKEETHEEEKKNVIVNIKDASVNLLHKANEKLAKFMEKHGLYTIEENQEESKTR